MPDLEVVVFNQKLKLSYQEHEKKKLVDAVEALNKNWNKFSELHGRVSDLKIITLISLELQDSIGDINILKDKLSQCNSKVSTLENEIEIKNKELQDKIEKNKKLELESIRNIKEVGEAEIILDELDKELLQIKSKLLNN